MKHPLLKAKTGKCPYCKLDGAIMGYARVECVYSPTFHKGKIITAAVDELDTIVWECVDCHAKVEVELADDFKVS